MTESETTILHRELASTVDRMDRSGRMQIWKKDRKTKAKEHGDGDNPWQAMEDLRAWEI